VRFLPLCAVFKLQYNTMIRWASLLGLTFAGLLFLPAPVRAEDAAEDVWLVSTREISHCLAWDAIREHIRYWRSEGDCGWRESDARDFHAEFNPDRPTIVFIHGNQTDAGAAAAKGRFAHRILRDAAAGCPFRFVIWSWPADRVCRRNRPDVQIKADASDEESVRLAAWLDGLRPAQRVCLIGHSFGPRIIAGALHLLAGGTAAGTTLPAETVAAWRDGRKHAVRAVLLAAAIDADWLAPHGQAGRALPLLDRAIATRNACDRALRWYPRLYGRGGPEALGFCGPCGLADFDRLAVVDVSATVGRTHDVLCYLSAPNLRGLWAQAAFLDDAPPAALHADNH